MYLSALIFFALLLITLLSFKLSLQLNKSIQNRFSSFCCMILMIIISHTFLEFFLIRCWNNKLYFLLPLACMSLTVLFDSQIYRWVWIGSFFLVLSRLFEYLERARKIFMTFAFSLAAIVYSWMVLYSSDIADKEEGPFFVNLGIVLAIDQALKVVISFFFSLWFLYSGKLQSLHDHCIGKFGINMLIEPQPRDESQANMCGAEIEVPEPIDKNKQELFPALPEPTLSPLASNEERKLSQISTNINSFEKKKQKKFLIDFDSKKKEKHFQAPDRTGHRRRKRNFLTIQEKLDENNNIETIHLGSKLQRDNWRHQRQQTHFQTPSSLKKRGRYSRNPSIQTTEALPQEFCIDKKLNKNKIFVMKLKQEISGSMHKEGMLQKRSRVLKNWRERWTVLTSNYLFTFKEARSYSKPTEHIPLDSILTVKSLEDVDRANCFVIATNDGTFFFTAQTPKQKEQWIGQINKAMMKKKMNKQE